MEYILQFSLIQKESYCSFPAPKIIYIGLQHLLVIKICLFFWNTSVAEEKPDSSLEKQNLLGYNPVNRGFFASKLFPDLLTLLRITQQLP